MLNPILLEFYQYWWKEVHKRRPSDNVQNFGLCAGMLNWLKENYPELPEDVTCNHLSVDLSRYFPRRGCFIPFNDYLGDLIAEGHDHRCHLNVHRVEFVRARLFDSFDQRDTRTLNEAESNA